jgi:hypothetical protein
LFLLLYQSVAATFYLFHAAGDDPRNVRTRALRGARANAEQIEQAVFFRLSSTSYSVLSHVLR